MRGENKNSRPEQLPNPEGISSRPGGARLCWFFVLVQRFSGPIVQARLGTERVA